MRLLATLAAVAASASLVVACGGGGGGGGGGASSKPQLNPSVVDLRNFQNTFADTSKLELSLVQAPTSLFSWLGSLKTRSFLSHAYAQNLSQCDTNVRPIGIEINENTSSVVPIDITSGGTDKPCFLSSQEVGAYIAAQTLNVFSGNKQCDITLLPKAGGKLFCYSVNIPSSFRSNGSEPVFKFNQAFAGVSSLAALGGQVTRNGNYFFVAFSDSGRTIQDYDGVFRFDLTGDEPVGDIVYFREASNPRNISFDGYQPLENGDLIVSHRENNKPMDDQRRFTYYVDASQAFTGIDNKKITLINDAVQYGFDANSPLFKWAIENLATETITGGGGSQNIIFSASSSPTDKNFYILLQTNRYRDFAGEFFNQILLKGSIENGILTFEDYGPSSISFFGTATTSEDLTKIYWVKDWNQGSLSVVTRPLEPLFNDNDRNFIPETEVQLSISIPNNHNPTLVYPTENYVFISTIPPDFHDRDNLMNLELFVAPKSLNSTSWASSQAVFTRVDLAGFTGDDYQLLSGIPSLVSDLLNFRVKRISDGTIYSLNISPNGVESLDLGNKGAVPENHAVVRGSSTSPQELD